MSIYKKRIEDLTLKEKKEINNLILSNFEKSRLNTYEYICYYTDKTNKYLSLNQLCVNNDYRNGGIATKLISYICEDHIENPIILYIDKNKENTEYLYQFYLKRGFKEISYLKTFNLTYEKDKEILMIYEYN